MSAPIKCEEVSPELQKLLDEHPSLHLINDGKKVKCDFTSHEMPARADAVLSYIQGKKYQKHYSAAMCFYDRQHLVPSSKRQSRHQLFCKLTLRHLNNTPTHIERHVKGKRFQKALARWQECQRTGTKFIPRGGQKAETSVESKKEKESWESNSDSDEGEDDDDLADLYPAEDFEDIDEDSNRTGNVRMSADNEEFDFDNMDVENLDDARSSVSSAKKNKKGEKRSKSSNGSVKKLKRT